MEEMIHLQKLGELILLLGNSIDYSVRARSGSRLWTPGYVNCVDYEADIVPVNIEGERAAINQYIEPFNFVRKRYNYDHH